MVQRHPSLRRRGDRLRPNAGRAVLVTATAMAAAALFVRHKTRRAERDNPPTGRFVEVQGVRLHYVERGQGQPVVLLHGNGTMTQDFGLSGLLDLAAERYRVIAFDRPGFGHSTRPRRGRVWTPKAQAALLHEALHRLGIERPAVVGHSWGSLVALELALEYPRDVGALVLLSGYYYPTARLDVLLLSPPALPIVGDLMRYTISPLLGRLIWPGLLRRLFGPAPVPARFGKFPVWMALRPSQLRASAAETALLIPCALALRGRYGELTVPVVIAAGAEDRYVDTGRQSMRLHRELPSSRLSLASGAGHMVHHTEPRVVMDAIEAAAQAA
jgi:pimeloyl-ACP methyl ester carboxylesterase